MNKREFTYPSSDGIHQIHAIEWIPDGTPKGAVQIVHGICEYVDRYDEFASYLCRQGWYVAGEDHLGHGGTAKDKEELGFTAETDGWFKMTDDLERLSRYIRENYPDIPLVMLGHSMGSFLARTFLCRYPKILDGCMLSGTGQVAPAVTSAGKLVAKVERKRLGSRGRSDLLQSMAFGAYNKNFKPVKTGCEWISRDEAQVAKYASDPYTQFLPTTTLFGDMMGGLQYIWDEANLKNMDTDLPIYIYSGDMDPVGGEGKQVRQVCDRFKALGCRDVTLKLYAGGRHEMHNEVNRLEVYRDVAAWLESKFPG